MSTDVPETRMIIKKFVMIISHLLKDVADFAVARRNKNKPSSRYNIEPVPQEMPLRDDGSAKGRVLESRH